MYSDWAVFAEDNDNDRGQKYPFLERTAFNPGSINIYSLPFATTMKKKKCDNE